MDKPIFKLGDIVESKNGIWGPVLIVHFYGQTCRYFIDPYPGADSDYEYIWIEYQGQPLFTAGNWYWEKDLKLYESTTNNS